MKKLVKLGRVVNETRTHDSGNFPDGALPRLLGNRCIVPQTNLGGATFTLTTDANNCR